MPGQRERVVPRTGRDNAFLALRLETTRPRIRHTIRANTPFAKYGDKKA